jgi:hypothetical protein
VNSCESIPLITAGDSFLIELEVHERHVQILAVQRFHDNLNSEASSERFRDLDPETKRAVIAQVNRRHPTRMVRT